MGADVAAARPVTYMSLGQARPFADVVAYEIEARYRGEQVVRAWAYGALQHRLPPGDGYEAASCRFLGTGRSVGPV